MFSAGNSSQYETVVTRILNKLRRQTHGNQCKGKGITFGITEFTQKKLMKEIAT